MSKKPELILGTVQLGVDYGINNALGRPSYEESKTILDLALRNNVRSLDTAPAYGNAQEVIGQFHSNANSQFKIISKFHKDYNYSISHQINRTLNTLRINALDVILFHSFDDFINFPELLDQLIEEKNKGTVKHIGVSVYNNEEIERVLDMPEIQVIQSPFNLLDNENKRGEIFRLAKLKNKIIHVRSVFLQGAFFMSTDQLPNSVSALSKPLKLLKDLATHYQLSIQDLAMGYVSSKSYIDGVLVGVDSVKQLASNLESFKVTLDKDLIEAIDSINIENTSVLNPSNW